MVLLSVKRLLRAGISDFGPTIDPKWDKSMIFSEQTSVYFGLSSQNGLKPDVKISQFVPFVENMTHFLPESNTTDSQTGDEWRNSEKKINHISKLIKTGRWLSLFTDIFCDIIMLEQFLNKLQKRLKPWRWNSIQ